MKIKNLKLKNVRKSSGQVALVVMLVSAVVMTMGLSLAKKTVVDTRVETNEEQLKQAFNAAESGIDYYLGTGSTNFVAPDSESKADVAVRNIGSGSTINFDQYTLTNSNAQFWLVGHNQNGDINYADYYSGSSLSVCVDSAFSGALKIDYFYQDSLSNYKVSRFGYNFESGYIGGFADLNPLPPRGGCATNYREVVLSAILGGGNKPLFISIRPYKSGAKIYLLGSGPVFPVQGIELNSIGRVSGISTGVNRSLNVVRLYQVPSFVMDVITTYGSVLSN